MSVVTQEAFDKIECNRCGECCEDFYLNMRHGVLHGGALGFLEGYGQYNAAWQKYHENGGKEIGSWDPGWYASASMPEEKVASSFVSMLFFGQLELRIDDAGMWKAKCGHFKRGDDGMGICTNYEDRPDMCSRFPYGKPTESYPSCTWNVEILDYDVVMA